MTNRKQGSHSRLSRREALARIAGAAVASPGVGLGSVVAGTSESEKRPRLTTAPGLVIYDCLLRRKWMLRRSGKLDLFEPWRFLQHCHALGFGGMQANLDGLSDSRAAALGDWAKQRGMFIDAIVSPPADKQDLARTLRFVQMHQADALQQVSSLSLEKQVALEDANLSASLKYAREELGM